MRGEGDPTNNRRWYRFLSSKVPLSNYAWTVNDPETVGSRWTSINFNYTDQLNPSGTVTGVT